MLKRICVFELNARLYQSNGESYIFPFSVFADNDMHARIVLEKILD